MWARRVTRTCITKASHKDLHHRGMPCPPKHQLRNGAEERRKEEEASGKEVREYGQERRASAVCKHYAQKGFCKFGRR